MAESTVSLSFSCPKKWNTMHPDGNGRFCTDCKKTVTDFSAKKISTLADYVAGSDDPEMCGSFRAYQLHRPFNNWIDFIISRYQKVLLHTTANRLVKPVMLFMLSVILVVTGCARRTVGRVCKVKSHKHATVQTAEYKR